MVELGWAGIPFPEEHGGLAFGYKGLGVVTEETGRTLAASPLYATVWVGGTILNIGGNPAQKAEWLPKVTRGELLLALALEDSHRHRPYGITTTAVRSGDGYALSGAKQFVLDGHVAGRLIVAARMSGEAGERDGISLFLVDPQADSVRVTRTKMVDSRNAANIELKDARVGRGRADRRGRQRRRRARSGVGHRPHRYRRGNARQHPGVFRAHRPVPQGPGTVGAPPTCSVKSNSRNPACSRR